MRSYSAGYSDEIFAEAGALAAQVSPTSTPSTTISIPTSRRKLMMNESHTKRTNDKGDYFTSQEGMTNYLKSVKK